MTTSSTSWRKSSIANAELVGDSANVINKQIAQIMDKAGQGKIDGQAAYNIKRNNLIVSERSWDEAYHARELRDVLMDGLNDSQARKAQRNLQRFVSSTATCGRLRRSRRTAQKATFLPVVLPT